MAVSISAKQKQILDFIKSTKEKRGYPPSIREIGDAVGLSSTSTVHGYLKRMEAKGLIKRDPSKPRALEVIYEENKTSKPELINIPIVGQVAAGQPILANEDIEEYFPLPSNFVQNSEAFILTIKGDSMYQAGILDKDYIVVRRQNVAQNGDIVVALIGNESTVKRFYKEDDYIRLQPENPLMDPIITKEVKILGKVIGVLRKL